MQDPTLPAQLPGPPLQHAVVIATLGRPELAKAVSSVRDQTLSPSWLVVCVDGSPQDLKAVERAVQEQFRGRGLQVHILLNDRSRGASETNRSSRGIAGNPESCRSARTYQPTRPFS